MRKFDIPKRKSKKAYPRAEYLGEVVSVRGVSHLDEAQRTYYSVRPLHSRQRTKAVRCDKLTAL